MAAAMPGLVVAANQQAELAGVFSTFAADTPQSISVSTAIRRRWMGREE